MKRSLLATRAAAAALLLAAHAGADPPPAAPTAAPDVRIAIVEALLQDQVPRALALVESALRMPSAARPVGLQYVQAHLLEIEGRQQEAADAFSAAMTAYPPFAPYARYRLAIGQARLGHPEVSAGLLATLLGDHPPAVLTAPALRLLRGALGAGGDCRLLRGIDNHDFATPERRQLELAQADCLSRAGDKLTAIAHWTSVLEADRADDAAREAADRLAELPAEARTRRTDVLIGLALNLHREFERSSLVLDGPLNLIDTRQPKAPVLSPQEDTAVRYARARNDFWLGQYASAARRFEALVSRHPGADEEAQALYQEGRSFEMLANWRAASAAFRRSYLAEPNGEYAPSALYAALRVEWISGGEAEALKLNKTLTVDRRWRIAAARAGVFLAAADIVRGRTDRAAAFLAQAERGGAQPAEVAFWRGRLLELTGKLDAAVLAFAQSLRRQPYGLVADAVRARLATPALAGTARAVGQRLAAGPGSDELWQAWLLLGDDSPAGGGARMALGNLLAREPLPRLFLYLTPVPIAAWPLWRAPLRDPEELLLALGMWSEGAPAVSRYFPLSDPALALTGAQLLARAGETRRTLYVAEILHHRVPAKIPTQLLPAEFRRILFPLPWRNVIETEARRQGVDPSLLAAIVREESRFDPRAVSAASARGLAQFVLPTARRIGQGIGLAELSASDLERPEISIALGAAYLAQLQRQLGGTVQAVAAYNAGEMQAELWRAYCTSQEPAEYFSKLSFRETRGYVEEVLSSRAQYNELYTHTP